MPIPYKSRGTAPLGSNTRGRTKHQEQYMENMESPYPSWHVDAECSEYDPDLFMISTIDSPDIIALAVDGYVPNDKDVRNVNLDKLGEAKAVCDSCLVRKECEESANESDLYWTIRAGKTRGVGRPVGRPPIKPPVIQDETTTSEIRFRDGRLCLRGHGNQWAIDGRNSYRCLECDRLRKEAAAHGAKIEPVRALPNSETCIKGHSEWRIHTTKGRERRICVPCKRERDRLFKAGKSAKMKA
jgi:hypothetical protein